MFFSSLKNTKNYVVIKFAIGTFLHCVNAIPLYPYILHFFIIIIRRTISYCHGNVITAENIFS